MPQATFQLPVSPSIDYDGASIGQCFKQSFLTTTMAIGAAA